MNETINQLEPMEEQESSIDYGKLLSDLLKHKKLFIKVLSVTFVFACFIGYSIPKTYKCTVLLSPEMSGSKNTSGLAALASNFGVNLKGALGNSTEALFPTLYPDMMESVVFKTSLFPIPVTLEGDKDEDEPDRVMTYYDYLQNEWKRPWWGTALKAIREWLVSLFVEEKPEPTTINPFRLTEKQTAYMMLIEKNIVCDVDQKTMVITIEVTDQDPLICATMADSVKTRLQKFITDYRTSKARVDYEYNLKLSKEAEARYDKACRDYVNFTDANRKIFLEKYVQQRVKLENEMQIQRGIYQQVIAQLQQAEMRIQEETPAFTTLQSATVPLRPVAPRKKLIALVFLFLAFVCTSAWVFNKEGDLMSLLGLSSNVKDSQK